MTHSYDWTTERERADQLFDDTPGDILEQTIISHFTQHPGRVHQLITTIGKRVQDGKIHSGWPILLKELERVPPRVQANDDHEREAATALVEKWLRNAGGCIDNEDELTDAVFGPNGRLYRWRDDETLSKRILELWQQERPRFAKAEHDTEQLAQQRVQLRQRLRANTLTTHDTYAAEHTERIAQIIENARDGTPLDLTGTPLDLHYLDTIIDTSEEAA